MSATAKMLLDCGWVVSGSDSGCAPPISLILEGLGIACVRSYSAGNLPNDAALIVVGKHEGLRPETNSEVLAAFNSEVPVVSYPDVLRELTRATTNLVVAGSYGKSTITTLLSFALRQVGHEPSFMIGAVPQNDLPTAMLSSGGVFVLEGDEYPSSNWDQKPKFLHYNPTNVILTSCEHDHLNVYRTHQDYLNAFHALGSIIPSDGLLVTCLDKPGTASVAAFCRGKIVTYSTSSTADYTSSNVTYSQYISFDLNLKGRRICTLKSRLFGLHNVENILGASALLLELGLVEPTMLVDIVAEFRGVVRRLEPIDTNGVVPIYEDIASARGKARASISAVLARHPGCRLVVIFQPYSLSFRNKAALSWYRDIFEGVGLLVLIAPPPLGNASGQLDVATIRDTVVSGGVETIIAHDIAHLPRILEASLSPKDVVLVVSSGPVHGIIDDVARLTTKLFDEEGVNAIMAF
jgi:UDP-N-acetylmuramate: L-alanyl-gamma-D-glutamyl-meso-diaminopimelate ligase